MNTYRTLALAIAIAVGPPTGGANAQVTPDEHASHHPGGGQEAGQDSGVGGMGGMGGMMDNMHAPPQRELYPSLMALDDLPLEERAAIQSKAHDRMKRGTARLADGLRRLSEAAPGDDFAAMQAALEEMREGLADFESGLAAHRALAEGRSPRDVALHWFKREMSLLALPPSSSPLGPFGLSWFHFTTMVLLVVFAATMIGMYFFKMRRATRLLAALGDSSTSVPAPVAPTAPSTAPSAAPQPTDAHSPVPPAAGMQPRLEEPAPASTPASTGPWSGSLEVACILDETPGIKTFRLVVPGGGPMPFRFRPGQFLTLSVTPEGEPVRRSYTIASAPTVSEYVEITVKREATGLVSRHLHDTVAIGDLLDVKAPSGRFTFTGIEAPSIVLIGGGVGITPLMSVIRHLTDRGWKGEITLLYCCRSSADFVYREELEFRQKRHPNLNVVATMTREAGTVWMGPRGRLTAELILGAVPDIAHRRVHVRGPPPMMDAMVAILRDLGVPEDQVKTEAFGPARKPASGAPSRGPTEREAGSTEIASAAGTVEATATVTFSRSGRSAALPPDTPILDVADALGIEIENSCRVGSCGSCRVKLISGDVSMDVDDGLEPEDRDAGFVLACQAVSDGDVTVDA